MKALFLALVISVVACGGGTEPAGSPDAGEPGSPDAGDPGPADASGPQGPVVMASLTDYLFYECAWRSRCEGVGLEACFSLVREDDLGAFYGNWMANGLDDRFDCVRNARTCEAYDASMNTNTCTFTVSVVDTVAPTITCSSNLTIECTTPAGATAITVTMALQAMVWRSLLRTDMCGSDCVLGRE